MPWPAGTRPEEKRVRLAQSRVLIVAYRFKPFVGAVGTRCFERHVAHPAVACGAMPVLHAGRNKHHGARRKGQGLLAPFLVPPTAIGAQQNLPAAAASMVDMPVIAAARLKCHVGNELGNLRVGQGVQERLPRKVLGKAVVGVPSPKSGVGASAEV